jgi:hypothetical protein
MIQGLEYWYDGQMRRFLEQIVRAFSGFQYMTGWREVDGQRIPPQLKMVPCTLDQTDRVVAHILKNQSENTLLTVPRITVAHTGLQLRRGDLQHPGHVDTRQVFEREFDPESGRYLPARGERSGRSYTVERLMPRPFEMLIQVDIWTSNRDQKHQLAEQILTVIAPDFQIQNSDNALDWTALTYMELQDINLSSRSVPVGTDGEIDIMTLNLRLPFWLSPPAKVTQQKVIEQIVTNVHDARSNEEATDQNQMFRHITTPGNHAIEVRNGTMKLLGPEGATTDDEGNVYDWRKLISLYGDLRPTLSQVRLKTAPEQIEDWSHDMIGTIQYDATRPNMLFWQIDPDTLPANTQGPVDAVINPLKTWPGEGLPGQHNGQRYLVLHDIAGPSQAWGSLRAHMNDIIEYRQGAWTVTFSPVRGDTAPHFVLNLKSGNQLRWNGEDWVMTIDGLYAPGYWRFSL